MTEGLHLVVILLEAKLLEYLANAKTASTYQPLSTDLGKLVKFHSPQLCDLNLDGTDNTSSGFF